MELYLPSALSKETIVMIPAVSDDGMKLKGEMRLDFNENTIPLGASYANVKTGSDGTKTEISPNESSTDISSTSSTHTTNRESTSTLQVSECPLFVAAGVSPSTSNLSEHDNAGTSSLRTAIPVMPSTSLTSKKSPAEDTVRSATAKVSPYPTVFKASTIRRTATKKNKPSKSESGKAAQNNDGTNTELIDPRKRSLPRYETRSVLNSLKSPPTTSGFSISSSNGSNTSGTSTIYMATTDHKDVGQNENTSSSKNYPRNRRGKRKQQFKRHRPQGAISTELFPFKLARFLRDTCKTSPEFVHWTPEGDAFFINARTKAESNAVGRLVAPIFNHANYDALRRQLNLYGFQRLQFGPNKGAWYNALFHRDFLTVHNLANVKVGCRPRRLTPTSTKQKSLTLKEQENTPTGLKKISHLTPASHTINVGQAMETANFPLDKSGTITVDTTVCATRKKRKSGDEPNPLGAKKKRVVKQPTQQVEESQNPKHNAVLGSLRPEATAKLDDQEKRKSAKTLSHNGCMGKTVRGQKGELHPKILQNEDRHRKASVSNHYPVRFLDAAQAPFKRCFFDAAQSPLTRSANCKTRNQIQAEHCGFFPYLGSFEMSVDGRVLHSPVQLTNEALLKNQQKDQSIHNFCGPTVDRQESMCTPAKKSKKKTTKTTTCVLGEIQNDIGSFTTLAAMVHPCSSPEIFEPVGDHSSMHVPRPTSIPGAIFTPTGKTASDNDLLLESLQIGPVWMNHLG